MTPPPGPGFSVTVAAYDAGNHPVPSYSGTVHVTSSDPAATLPADTTLVNGTTTFDVTLATSGSQSVTVVDTVTQRSMARRPSPRPESGSTSKSATTGTPISTTMIGC